MHFSDLQVVKTTADSISEDVNTCVVVVDVDDVESNVIQWTL